MAVALAVRGILLIFCCTAGLSSARSLQASQNEAENDVNMTQMMTTSEVHCEEAGCDYDLQLYCLANGVIIMGSCSLKNSLCSDGERNALQLAKDWNSCFLATYTVHHPQQMVMVHTNYPHSSNNHIKGLDTDTNPGKGQLLDTKMMPKAHEDPQHVLLVEKTQSVEDGLKSATQEAEDLKQAGDTKMADWDAPDLLDLQLEQELSKSAGKVKNTGVTADVGGSGDKA